MKARGWARIVGKATAFGVGKWAAVVTLVLALAACSPVFRNHGYAPDDDQLALVEVGSSTRADVADAVGRPSAQGILSDSGWFYVQSRFKHFTYNAPEEIDREVVSISFDSNGVVSNVERFGLEQGRVVTLSRRVTQSNIQGVSFLTQLFRNVGQIDPSSFFEEGL